jgi:hypothetical protein
MKNRVAAGGIGTINMPSLAGFQGAEAGEGEGDRGGLGTTNIASVWDSEGREGGAQNLIADGRCPSRRKPAGGGGIGTGLIGRMGLNDLLPERISSPWPSPRGR